MKSIKKTIYSICIVSLVAITLSSCTSKINVPQEYIITKESLKDSLSVENESIVFFWTGWCGGSKMQLQNHYLPLADSIKSQDLDVKLLLIASDENIPLTEVQQYREKGISVFYLERPGTNPIANRMAIKKFINKSFPDNNFTHLDKFGFGIPVSMLIDKDLNIVNEKEYNKSFTYVLELLGAKFD